MPIRQYRYTVIIERDQDCEDDFTDGSGKSGVEQLVKELQSGWDTAGIAGHFHVSAREVVPSGATPLHLLPRDYADDPGYVAIENLRAEVYSGLQPIYELQLDATVRSYINARLLNDLDDASALSDGEFAQAIGVVVDSFTNIKLMAALQGIDSEYFATRLNAGDFSTVEVAA